MSDFMSKEDRTPEYERAVQALTELLTKRGIDDVERAYGEAVHARLKADFAKEHGKEQTHARHPCVHRLAGKRCPRKLPCASMSLPAADHLSGWIKDGKLDCLVSQPYGMSYENVKKTVEFCEHFGLEADIDSWMAWHFPGRTLRVTYTRKPVPRPIEPVDVLEIETNHA